MPHPKLIPCSGEVQLLLRSNKEPKKEQDQLDPEDPRRNRRSRRRKKQPRKLSDESCPVYMVLPGSHQSTRGTGRVGWPSLARLQSAVAMSIEKQAYALGKTSRQSFF